MDDHIWRLAWALPLVLALGVGLIFWLKRLGVGMPHAGTTAHAPSVLSTTAVSEATRAIVVEVDGKRFIVFESSAHIAVQALATEVHSLTPRLFGRKPT